MCCPCLSHHLGSKLTSVGKYNVYWHELEQSNKGICSRFDIKSYPTLYWGTPEALASGGGFAKEGLESIGGKDVSTDKDILEWVNKRMNK